MRKIRTPFDQAGPFVVRKSCLVQGKQYGLGDPLPAELLPKRRLRQMWERRQIDMAAEFAPSRGQSEGPQSSGVEVPSNWWSFNAERTKELCEALTGRAAPTKEEAARLIREHLNAKSS